MRRTLPPTLRPEVRAALAEARQALARLYGRRLVRVVLYGSHARGEAHAGSDVDVLAVLRGPLRLYDEVRRTDPVEQAARERHGVALSVHSYDEAAFADDERPFVRSVKADGVEL